MKTQWAAVTTHSLSIKVPPHRWANVFLSPRNIKSSTCQGHEPSLACSPPTIRDNRFRSPQMSFGCVETATGKHKITNRITNDTKMCSLNTQMTIFAKCLRSLQIPSLVKNKFLEDVILSISTLLIKTK